MKLMRHSYAAESFIYRFSVVLVCVCAAFCFLFRYQVDANLHTAWVGNEVVTQYIVMTLAMFSVWYFTPNVNTIHPYKWMIIAGVLIRVMLVLIEPYTSNDISRYLFDGRIALEGLDPYTVAHDNPALIDLRAAWAPPNEHAQYVSLYPPLAMGLFSIAASFGVEYAPFVWKVMTMLASVAILVLSVRVLQRAGLLKHLALVALSPILILEAGEGAHVDVFATLLIVLAVACWQKGLLGWMAVFLALGGLLKLLPIVLLGPAFFLRSAWRDKLTLFIASSATFLGGYAIAFAAGMRPVGSINVFFEKWRSGSPVFQLLESVVSGPILAAVILCLLLVGFLLIAYCAYRHTSDTPSNDTYLYFQCAMALPLLLSPVIFPWYVMPLCFLCALRPNVFLLAWIASLPLLYEVLGEFLCCGRWAPAQWPVNIIGASMLGVLLFLFWKKRAQEKTFY